MKTAGTFDSELMLLESTSNVTSTTTGTAVDVHGDDIYEMNVRAIVPQATGTTPKIVMKYQGSDDKSAWTDLYIFPDITAAGEYSKKLRGKGKYRRVVLTVSGTSPNFGKVIVGISTGGVL